MPSPRNSRKKNKSPKPSPIASAYKTPSWKPPSETKDLVKRRSPLHTNTSVKGGVSRSFPVRTSRRHQRTHHEAEFKEFKQRSRRQRSPPRLKTSRKDRKQSRKPGPSRKKVVAIYANPNSLSNKSDKHRSVSYIRSGY
jgi:hypothetical protein